MPCLLPGRFASPLSASNLMPTHLEETLSPSPSRLDRCRQPLRPYQLTARRGEATWAWLSRITPPWEGSAGLPPGVQGPALRSCQGSRAGKRWFMAFLWQLPLLTVKSSSRPHHGAGLGAGRTTSASFQIHKLEQTPKIQPGLSGCACQVGSNSWAKKELGFCRAS